MIVDLDLLLRFGACEKERDLFVVQFPQGLDISGLWGTSEEREATWRTLLANEFLRRNVGWAISKGLIPARITADLRGADLRGADLSDADLRGADLSDADLRDADLSGADLSGADLSDAIMPDDYTNA